MANVLVVDADPLVLSTLEAMLTASGHRVSCASSPEEAISIAREQAADLMIVNFSSHRTGRELVEKVLEFAPNVSVLRTSTMVESDLRRSGWIRDTSQFIAKPFTAQQLAAAVERALSKDNASRFR